jgi:hypothetical protein
MSKIFGPFEKTWYVLKPRKGILEINSIDGKFQVKDFKQTEFSSLTEAVTFCNETLENSSTPFSSTFK